MTSSPFDFDVVTGPATPREQPKKAPPRPERAEEPQTGVAPAVPTPKQKRPAPGERHARCCWRVMSEGGILGGLNHARKQ